MISIYFVTAYQHIQNRQHVSKKHERYHLRGNDYSCKSLINSRTISVRKKYRNVRMKLQTLQVIQIFIECRIGCLANTYPSIHFFRLKTRSVVDCVGVGGVLTCVG